MTAKYFKNPQVTQGAILANFIVFSMAEDDTAESGAIKEILLPYCVIVSQACDIEQSNNDTGFLPNIMILPLYTLDSFKDGEHLEKCGYSGIKQEPFGNKKIEKLVKNSEYSRYHFLQKESEFIEHDIVADFKHYYTIPKGLVLNQFEKKYVSTINYLHRELLSQRFCNYLGRIGLP